jgi:hypothetical protein
VAEMPSVRVRGPGISGGSVPSMPEAPRLTNRVNTVEGASTPYRIGAEAFGRVEAAAASINDKIAVADAQKAAFKAVTRDETGKLNVTFMPGGTLVAEAYNKGALSSYSAQFRQQTRAAGAELHQKNRRNPQGFQADWAARSEIALQNLDPRVLTASTLLMAEVGMQHSNSLLEDQYRESRIRQDGAIKADINSSSKDIIEFLTGNPDALGLSSSMVKDKVAEIQTALDNQVVSGFGTAETSRAFLEDLQSKMLQAYAVGQAKHLMGGFSVEDGTEFQEHVDLVTHNIAKGTLDKDLYGDLNNASESDRFLAAKAFQTHMLSALAVNKNETDLLKARNIQVQAKLIAEVMELSVTDPGAVPAWLAERTSFQPRDVELWGDLTAQSMSTITAFATRHNLTRLIEGRKESQQAVFAALSADIHLCGTKGSGESVDTCTARVLRTAESLTLDGGEKNPLVKDGNKISAMQNLRILSQVLAKQASAAAAGRKMSNAVAAIQGYGGKRLPLSEQPNLDLFTKNDPQNNDVNQFYKIETDDKGGKVRTLDLEAVNRIAQVAGERGLWTSSQVSFMQSARKSGEGSDILAATRMFYAMENPQAGGDFSHGVAAQIGKGQGAVKDYAFYSMMEQFMKNDVHYTPASALANAKAVNERLSKTGEQVMKDIQERYKDGITGLNTDVRNGVIENFNEALHGTTLHGAFQAFFVGNRHLDDYSLMVASVGKDTEGTLSRLLNSNIPLRKEGLWSEINNWMTGVRKPFDITARQLIKDVVNSNAPSVDGDVVSLTRGVGEALVANNAGQDAAGRVMLNEPFSIALTTAKMAGKSITKNQAYLSMALQIKPFLVQGPDSQMINGIKERLFGGDRQENQLWTGINEGWIEPKFHAGADGQSSYYTWMVRDRFTGLVPLEDADGLPVRSYPQHEYINQFGETKQNEVLQMHAALDKIAEKHQMGPMNKMFWAYQMEEGMGYLMNTGGEIRNMAVRMLDIKYIASDNSMGRKFIMSELAVDVANSIAAELALIRAGSKK